MTRPIYNKYKCVYCFRTKFFQQDRWTLPYFLYKILHLQLGLAQYLNDPYQIGKYMLYLRMVSMARDVRRDLIVCQRRGTGRGTPIASSATHTSPLLLQQQARAANCIQLPPPEEHLFQLLAYNCLSSSVLYFPLLFERAAT